MAVIRRQSLSAPPATLPAGPVRVAAAVTCHTAYLPSLPACLAAVEAQTRRPDQFYLALDGCELSRQQEYDLRARGWQIRLGQWHSPNPGRQWALEATDCEWIWHVDADDVHDPGYLAGALTRIGDRHVAIVHADRARTDGSVLRTPEGHDYGRLRRHNYVDTSALWRVHALREAGGWRDTSRWDDWDCALRVTALGWRTARNPVASRCTVHPEGGNRNASGLDFAHVWGGRTWAVVCLLAGRESCWEDWSDVVLAMDYPPRTHVYLCDNSRSQAFSERVVSLAQDLALRGLSVSVLVLADPYDNRDWLSRHRHVASLYNRVLPRVTEDLVVFWEDDVIPPWTDSLRRMAEHYHPETVGGLCALYESRDRPGGACASRNHQRWSDCPSLVEARGQVLPGMGFLPGGFAIYNGALVREAYPFAITMPGGQLQGWDGQLGATVRAAGFGLALDGTVECEHRWRATA